ncbi:hypothetical protein K3495_g12064 [Podosphaera aphanis]|nr:hypothetical protein K3495_g12064 [Podosphaera aphanis]
MSSDRGSSNPYDLDQLTAMKWPVTMWDEVPNSGHPNSWQRAERVQHARDPATSDETSTLRAEVPALCQTAVGVPENRVSGVFLVHSRDEDFVEAFSMGELIESMTHGINPAT